MASFSNSPVYVRLTRSAGWPSNPHGLRNRIGAAGFLVALIGVALPFSLRQPLLGIPAAFILTGVAFVLLSPLLALIVTAIGLGAASSAEDLKLVMLSNLTPHDVVYGYYRAALHRLRLLSVIGIGLVPGVAVSLAHAGIWRDEPGSPSGIGIAVGATFALIFAGVGVGISAVACQVGAMVGVWLALEWRAQAPVVALGMLAASVILCGPLTMLLPCAGLFVLPVGLLVANQVAWQRAKRAVEARGSAMNQRSAATRRAARRAAH